VDRLEFHAALIGKYGDGTGINEDGIGWEKKWVLKYRYYKEIGEEIDKRVNEGKSPTASFKSK
jgi:hypothetical protein